MKSSVVLILLFFSFISFTSEPEDVTTIRKIYDDALENGKSYGNLTSLCTTAPGRLSGTPQAEKAVQWGKKVLESMNLDTVYLQEVMVPRWVRGEKEQAEIRLSNGTKKAVAVTALGASVGTDKKGLTAEVIEVFQLSELEKLGEEKIKGKIVFYNRPMDPLLISTFNAYGGCVDQRSDGASEKARELVRNNQIPLKA